MYRANEQKLYDELVGLCYECLLDDSAWLPMLKQLIAASGRQLGTLLFWNQRSNRSHVFSTLKLCDPTGVDAYNTNHYHQLDPIKSILGLRTVGSWYHGLEDPGMQRIHCDPDYQSVHLTQGVHAISCVKLHEQADSGIYLSLLTAPGAPSPEPQQHALLQRISPHLLKAARLSEKINRLKLELSKRDLLLDRNPSPLWLLDGEGQVSYCNPSARQRMGQPGFTLYQQYGRLHYKTRDASLQKLIGQASGKEGARRAGWLRLGLAEQDLLITPMPAEAAGNGLLQKPLVLLALLENQPQSQLLAELFQLSPAELRLAELLAQGHTPQSCAARLNVSINTVRTQLRALFRKTETARQAELVNLFARLQQH
ncbi:MAG: LuxR C-terminal-related transcriptional regulator [Pseudomonas sp.]